MYSKLSNCAGGNSMIKIWNKFTVLIFCMSMLSIISAISVYAGNQPDAVRLYRDMETKAFQLDQIEADYDYNFTVLENLDTVRLHMVMDARAEKMKKPEKTSFQMHSNLAFTGTGNADMDALFEALAIKSTVSYQEGMYRVESPFGTQEWEASEEEKNTNPQITMGMLDTSLGKMENMELTKEGDERVIRFTMESGPMNDMLKMILVPALFHEYSDQIELTYHDVSGSYTVDAKNRYTCAYTKMAVDISNGNRSVTVYLEGTVKPRYQ